MANRPSNSEIEKILARKRKAGQPAKKSTASQANLEQVVKEAVNNALGETNENLGNFLKDFKKSIENKNKGAKKMSNIKNNDIAKKEPEGSFFATGLKQRRLADARYRGEVSFAGFMRLYSGLRGRLCVDHHGANKKIFSCFCVRD